MVYILRIFDKWFWPLLKTDRNMAVKKGHDKHYGKWFLHDVLRAITTYDLIRDGQHHIAVYPVVSQEILS